MRSLLLAFTSIAIVACGSSVSSTPPGGSGGQSASSSSSGSGSTSSGTSSSTSSGGLGGSGPSAGDCATDADCGGGKCVEIAPGGYKICTKMPPEATMCQTPGGPAMDQCCTSADCKQGKCYLSTSLPYCGGPAQAVNNVCVSDQCKQDQDCPLTGGAPALCAPAGAWGFPVRTCLEARCHTNADCNAKPGGVCEPIASACCGMPMGVACVYPGGCKKDGDCGSNAHCEIEPGGATACKPGPVGCPA